MIPDFFRLAIALLAAPVALGVALLGLMALLGGGVSATSLWLIGGGVLLVAFIRAILPRLD